MGEAEKAAVRDMAWWIIIQVLGWGLIIGMLVHTPVRG